jgi:hypothetical protein
MAAAEEELPPAVAMDAPLDETPLPHPDAVLG